MSEEPLDELIKKVENTTEKSLSREPLSSEMLTKLSEELAPLSPEEETKLRDSLSRNYGCFAGLIFIAIVAIREFLTSVIARLKNLIEQSSPSGNSTVSKKEADTPPVVSSEQPDSVDTPPVASSEQPDNVDTPPVASSELPQSLLLAKVTPIPKNLETDSKENLDAEKRREFSRIIVERQGLLDQQRQERLNQAQRTFITALASLFLGLLLIFIGVVCVFFVQLPVAIATAASSIIPGAISALAFRLYK